MDSFFEQPRNVPVPLSTQDISIAPVVPEVSMISQKDVDSNCSVVDSIYLTYSAWKARNINKNYIANSDETKKNTAIPSPDCGSSQDLFKKQVRFESSILPEQKLLDYRPSLQNIRYPYSRPNAKPYSHETTNNSAKHILPAKVNYVPKPFDEMYMANIPSRELDLSTLDMPSKSDVSKENINPNKDFNISKRVFNVQREAFFEDTDSFNVFRKSDTKKELDYNYTDFQMYQPHYKINKDELDVHNVKSAYTRDVLEKNRIIDLYNYKGNDAVLFSSSHAHQALDNTRLTRNNCARTVLSKNDSLITKTKLQDLHHDYLNDGQPVNTEQREVIIQTEKNPLNYIINPESVNKKDDEPTVRDLLKIIHQQNEQLLILQKQVSSLLNNRDSPKQIEASSHLNTDNVNLFSEKCQTSTQLESQNCLYNTKPKCLPQKPALQKFAVDVMTSFEVSVRRSQNLNRMGKSEPNHQPKIWEVTEVDSNAFSENDNVSNNKNKDTLKSDDMFLMLAEPMITSQTCPTPERSIQIDMEDFSSDSDQDECMDTAWTFYNNVMGQVNKILKKSGIQPVNSTTPISSNASVNKFKENIMKEVKAATITHLKSIGVHVPNCDENIQDLDKLDCNNRGIFDRNEVSFAVKQLLMKYLPAEQLAKIACTQGNVGFPKFTENTGLIKRRPEFSFATVQYMQKYNLLTDAADVHAQRSPLIEETPNCNKILDITAIKQQPKLL